MQHVLWVGVGGFLGAVLRYGLCEWMPSERFSVGTLLVNALGCLAIGAVAGWVEARTPLDPRTYGLLVVGVLGSFTTFSAFGGEVAALAQGGRNLAAGGVVAAHLTLGIGAVWIGRALTTWALRP